MRRLLYLLSVIFPAVCLWIAPLRAADFPGTFILNPGGDLSLEGLPGYRSTPARLAAPGFAFSYGGLEEVEERVFGASGEFGNRHYRVGFLGSYLELDSVYRQVYGEWDLSLCNSWVVVGAGYGLDMEWIPEVQSWTYHRYKLGATLYGWGMALSGLVDGWAGNPLGEMAYSLGLALNPGGRLAAFVEWDGLSADVGTSVQLGFAALDIVYRFPQFGVGLSLQFSLGNWFVQGVYGFSGAVWRWHGVSAGRRISKKTIL